MGDFYELFFEDAVIASKELDIALTSRGKYDGNPVPMCGVPYHAYLPYLEKLTKNNYKVAICEQTESPKEAKLRGGNKALVKREVVRIVTPGTLTEETLLDAGKNNFLLSISTSNEKIGIAWLDVSTGELYTESCSKYTFLSVIARVRPREILLLDTVDNYYSNLIKKTFDCIISPLIQSINNSKKAEKLICFHYGVKNIVFFWQFFRKRNYNLLVFIGLCFLDSKG